MKRGVKEPTPSIGGFPTNAQRRPSIFPASFKIRFFTLLFRRHNMNTEKISSSAEPLNFLEEIIEADLASGKYSNADILTRVPPEPNGYLHIGHATSICLNFGLALKYGGKTNLRFDDTNPVTEETEYVDSIIEDVRWLGFEPAAIFYASDYFTQLYEWAKVLISKGLAYVDFSSAEEIAALKGTPTEPGRNSPYRDTPPEENLALFEKMKAGEFPDGHCTLRAKIDMASPNMIMRDPLLYRIKHAHHHRTGDDWCIYPMYDWAHGQSDSLEHITHSICTMEFVPHRELYDWCIAQLGIFPSHQYEFARRNVSYVVTSKRKLKQLVEENCRAAGRSADADHQRFSPQGLHAGEHPRPCRTGIGVGNERWWPTCRCSNSLHPKASNKTALRRVLRCSIR